MTARRLRWLWPLSVALAFVAGMAHERAGGRVPDALAAPAAAPSPGIVTPQRGLTTEDVRAVVREELAASPVNQSREASRTEPEERPSATKQAGDPAALDRAHEALAHGMADRVWNEADRAALRATIATLDPEQMDEILGTLIPAINTDQLRVELVGPPI